MPAKSKNKIMKTTIGVRKTLPVSEVEDLLRPTLLECGAKQAFLCGPYVRADRNGDLRLSDDLVLLIVAEDMPAQQMDRYANFDEVDKAALAEGLLLSIHIHTPSEIEEAGGTEKAIEWFSPDWTQVL